MTRTRRLVLILVAVAAGIAILIASAPEYAGSGRLLILHRFFSRVGVSVSDAATPPSEGTFLLLLDRRDPAQEDQLLAWVEGGGRLVVADPTSPLLARFAIDTPSRVGVFGTSPLGADCVQPDVVGVRTLEVDATDRLLSTPAVSSTSCFSGGGGAAYAQFIRRGRGEIVVLGGFSFATDPLLSRADNAIFARTVLGGGDTLVFGPPQPPGRGDLSLWQTLPRSAKAVIWELIAAAVVFALARARRLGRPVLEEPISPIPASELVRASAALYRRARADAYCGRLLRYGAIERIARRLGLPADAGAELPRLVAAATNRDTEVVQRMLSGPDMANDEELAALGRELEELVREIEGAER